MMDWTLIIIFSGFCAFLLLYPAIFTYKSGGDDKLSRYSVFFNEILFISLIILFACIRIGITSLPLLCVILSGFPVMGAVLSRSMARKLIFISVLGILVCGVLIFYFIAPVPAPGDEEFNYLMSIALLASGLFLCINSYLLVPHLDIKAEPKQTYKFITIFLIGNSIILILNLWRGAMFSASITPFLHVISGQVSGVDISGISDIFFSITQDPVIQIIVFTMMIGGIVKAVNYPWADTVGTIIVSFIPIMIWVMIFLQAPGFEVPAPLLQLFPEFQWFAWLLYVVVTLVVFVAVVGAISMLTGLAKATF